MVDGNGTFLSINPRTKGGCAAEENTDLTVVHILNHLLTLLLILSLLDETDLCSRNAIVIDEFVLDLLEDIPLARLIGGKVAEDKLRTLLLVILLIIVGNHAGAMAGLIVGVITETLLGNKAHIQRGLTAGIGGNKHLTLHLTVIKRRTENQFSVTSLGELYQSLIKVLLVCRRLNVMQDDIHIRTVKADILTSTIVGNLIIEGCQFRHLHEITETLLLYNGISNGKLIIRRFLRIDSSPCVKAVNTLLSHSLGTKVLEQQIQLSETIADSRTTEERSTQILSCAVLDGTDGIQKVKSLLTASRTT